MHIAAVRTSSLENFLSMLGLLVILIFVLAITYWTTRWIANYQKGYSDNKNLRVVETLKITTNKYIQIVEVGNAYLVIGIGKDEIQLLTKLEKEELKDLSQNDLFGAKKTETFQDLFEKIKRHLPQK